MINLQVDEGYAFDYLAILSIKADMNLAPKAKEAYKKCYDFLKNQIGDDGDAWSLMMASPEMCNLKAANLITFNAVEKARYGEISAKEVDDANMLRYHAKVALQEKFFGTKPVETKS